MTHSGSVVFPSDEVACTFTICMPESLEQPTSDVDPSKAVTATSVGALTSGGWETDVKADEYADGKPGVVHDEYGAVFSFSAALRTTDPTSACRRCSADVLIMLANPPRRPAKRMPEITIVMRTSMSVKPASEDRDGSAERDQWRAAVSTPGSLRSQAAQRAYITSTIAQL